MDVENTPKKHIFISYSSDDSPFAEGITQKLLDQDIEVWIDRQGIELGTSDWEATIRTALQESFAVILVASPNSRRSAFVFGEINVAKSLGCEIFPVLVNGDWTDSVRLDMYGTQYTDLRVSDKKICDDNFDVLVRKLRSLISSNLPDTFLFKGSLQDISKLWRDYLPIKLPNETFAMVKDGKKLSIGELIVKLYMEYLSDLVPPYSYGKKWILANHISTTISFYYSVDHLVIYWEWLLERNSSETQELLDAYEWQTKHTLENFAIPKHEEENWKIILNPLDKNAYGIVLEGKDAGLSSIVFPRIELPMMEVEVRMPLYPRIVHPAKFTSTEYTWKGIFSVRYSTKESSVNIRSRNDDSYLESEYPRNKKLRLINDSKRFTNNYIHIFM